MICSNCTATIDWGWTYCGSCGTKIAWTHAPMADGQCICGTPKCPDLVRHLSAIVARQTGAPLSEARPRR